MIRRGRQLIAMGGGLVLVAAVVPGLRLRDEPRVLKASGGVVLERVDEALVPRGDRLHADDGDLLLKNGALQVVVGASRHKTDRQEYGALLDLTFTDWADDALGSLRSALGVAGRRAELVTDRVVPSTGPGAPGIRIQQHDPSNGLLLSTDVSINPKENVVELVTRVTNRGKAALNVRLGDDVAWPGELTFAPRHGDVEEPGHDWLRWIARRGPLAYGLVFPDEPSEVEFRVNGSDTDQTCWAPATELAAGGTARYRRVLVATRRGISDVARMAAAFTHEPLGRITGTLEPAPAWAILTAIASDGTIALKETIHDASSFDLAVPRGRYTLLLQIPGGWDQAPVEVGEAPATARLFVPQAERLDFRVTDPSGRPIPARLIVAGVDGTPDPRFASTPRVSAGGNEVHTVTGEGRVDVPPGRYRVIVSRGIEWSVATKLIEVRPEQGVALRVALSQEMPTPGFISADLHLHARPSGDSELPLDERVASLVSAGVEFAVATDHNHITDYKPSIDALDANGRLASARGVEVTTRTWGHFNAYPMPAGVAVPPFAKIDPPEIFAGIRKLSPKAVIQVNHPWYPGYGYFHRAALNERTGAHWRKQFSFDFDLLEVANGYELGKVDILGKNLPRYFDLLNLGRRYTAVGSSDSHKLTNEWAGYPRTYVRVPDDRPDHVTPDEIARALRDGHTVVSLGPFIDARIENAGPGDTATALPGKVPLGVTVRAPDWIDVNRIDVIVNGDTVESLDVGEADRRDGARFEQTIDIPVTGDSWVIVVARGERPIDEVLPGLHTAPFAFTSPIWVDVGEPPRKVPAPETPRRERPSRPEPESIVVPESNTLEDMLGETNEVGPPDAGAGRLPGYKDAGARD